MQEGKQQGWKEREKNCQHLQRSQGTSGSCPGDFYTHKLAKNEQAPGFTKPCHSYSGVFSWVGGWLTGLKEKVEGVFQDVLLQAMSSHPSMIRLQRLRHYPIWAIYRQAKGMSLVPSHPPCLSSGSSKWFEHCTQSFPCPLPCISTSHYIHQ